MKAQKILFCDNTLWGLLNFRGEIISHFLRKGYEIILAAPEKENVQMTLPIPNGVKFISLDMGRSDTGIISNLSYFRNLYKIIKQERPDHIFLYTIKPNIFGSIAAHHLKIKSTAMIAGLGTIFTHNSFKYRVARYLYKVALKFTDKIIVLNTSNKEYLIEHHICKESKIIHLEGGEGVNLQAFPFHPNESPTPTFLFVGRLLEDKGYNIFVEAAKAIKQQHANVNFAVLGFFDPASPQGISKEQVDNDVAHGYIKYLGFTHDMQSIYKQKGVILTLPSYYGEGMNRTLMEACASGKPIITSNIPGCKELVRDGVNGFIIEPRSVQSLIDAIGNYLRLSEQQRATFSVASREHAEKTFDIEKVKRVYDDIILK